MESRAGTTNRKHPRVLSTNKSTSGGKEWRRRTTTVPRSSASRRRACRRCSDHAPPHRTVAPTLPSEQDPLPPRRGNLCSAVVALGGRCVEERGYSFLRRLSPPTQNGSLICILCWSLMHTATVRFERHFCLCVPVCVRCWRKP